MYTVTNVLKDGAACDITPLVTSIRWGGDIRQAGRKLEVGLAFGRDEYLPEYDVPLGSLLILKSGNKELLRGAVFSKAKDTEGGYSLVAYDHLYYLVKSKHTYIFQSVSAQDITAKLCGDFSVDLGSMPDPGIIFDKLILRDKTIYDMLLTAWTETSKRSGQKYIFRMMEGKLHIIAKTEPDVLWQITEKSNLISASYSESIENMKNSIVIIADKDRILARVEDADLIKQYGLLQDLQRQNSIKPGEAQILAQNYLEELGKVSRDASVTCLGIDNVEAGTAIKVTESLTGITGTFCVDTDSHEVADGQHTMNLKLNRADETANMDIPEV